MQGLRVWGLGFPTFGLGKFRVKALGFPRFGLGLRAYLEQSVHLLKMNIIPIY